MNLFPEHPGVELGKLIHKNNMNLSQFARKIDVSSSRISEIVAGKRAITTDTALRIAKAFNTLPEYWLVKQCEFNLFTQSQN